MKKIFTISAAVLLICSAIQAQQQSRLIGLHGSRQSTTTPGQLVPYDTTTIIYKDNTKGMDLPAFIFRSSDLDKMKADSIHHFKYDATGQLIYEETNAYKYNSQNMSVEHLRLSSTNNVFNGPLEPVSRYRITYDAAGTTLINEVEERWVSAAWQPWYETSYVYNGGNLEKVTYEKVNGTPYKFQELEYTYTAGKIATRTATNWNISTGVFTNKVRNTYTYNSNGELVQDNYEEYDVNTMAFYDVNRTKYTLNQAGKIEYTLIENWDRNNSVWVNASQSNYYITGNVQEDTTEVWNALNSTWEPSATGMHKFDANGNDTFTSRHTWDAVNSTWKPSYIYIWSYDANSNNTGYIYQTWNADSMKCVNNYQILQAFNNFDQQTYFLDKNWDLSTNKWLDNREEHYYYELYNVGVNDFKALEANVKVYPIPATDAITLNIQWETARDFSVAITNIEGRIVRSSVENGVQNYSKQIPVSGMGPGMYYMTVSNGSQSTTKQFVITQ